MRMSMKKKNIAKQIYIPINFQGNNILNINDLE